MLRASFADAIHDAQPCCARLAARAGCRYHIIIILRRHARYFEDFAAMLSLFAPMNARSRLSAMPRRALAFTSRPTLLARFRLTRFFGATPPSADGRTADYRHVGRKHGRESAPIYRRRVLSYSTCAILRRHRGTFRHCRQMMRARA